MSETSPTSPEKTVVITTNPLCRLWTLVFISLGLNGLILLVLLIGFLCHHRHGPPRFVNGADRGGALCRMDERGFGHHFRGFGWHKFGMRSGSWDEGGCPVMEHMGMMRGGDGPGMGIDMMKNGPPSPADIADRILNGLSSRLSLTDDQKAKLRPVIEQQVIQMQKLMEDTKVKVKPILNADQQKQLDEIKLPGQQNPPGAPSGESHP